MTKENTEIKDDVTKTAPAAVDDKAAPPAGDPAPKTGPYRPDGLPDHLVGADEKETIDRLAKAYDGARKELGGKKNVPEKLDDYKIELPKEIAEKVLQSGEDGKDPVFEKIRGILHANGVDPQVGVALTQGLYEEVLVKLNEKAATVDGTYNELDPEFKSFGDAAAAEPVIEANKAWITGLKTKGVIDDKDAEEMLMHVGYGVGLKWIDKIRTKISGEQPIPVNMDTPKAGGDLSKEKLDEMMQDERYWKTKDPDYIAEVTKNFQKFYNQAA